MGTEIHVERHCLAPLAQTFAYVDDWRHVPEWMFGVEKFEPVDGRDHGLGALFDVVVHLGLPVRTRIEVTDWVEGERLEFHSVTGFKVDSRWTFREEVTDAGPGTLVEARVTYHLPFGPAGRVMGKVMEPAVASAVKHSSTALVRHVEEHAARQG